MSTPKKGKNVNSAARAALDWGSPDPPPPRPATTSGLFGSMPSSTSSLFGGYSVPAVSPTKPASLQKPTLALLKASLTTGVFIDCLFYLYSRRTSHDTIDTPLPLYASSEVLKKTAEHFQSLISGGFSESFESGNTGMSYKLPTRIAAGEYEYESDSDLEEDGEDKEDEEKQEKEEEVREDLEPSLNPGLFSPAFQNAKEVSRKDVSVATEPAELSAAEAPPAGSLVSPGCSPNGLQEDPAGSSSAASVEDDFHPLSTSIPVHHVVVIPDVAFKTFKALVYYAYTGDINFATLKSARRASGERNPIPPSPTLACSPKSMYRLADKYGMVELKNLAAKNIRSQLSWKNAMYEVLSNFTARYPEIIRIETDFICGSNARLNCFSELPQWTQMLVGGELPHAGDALAELIRRLAGGS